MGVVAAIREMMAKGFTMDQALMAAEIMEANSGVDAQAERRRAVDRARKRNDWSALRISTFERDGYRCVYCSVDVSDDPQCDHVMPISRGGENVLENLATACRPCNSRKCARTPMEWLGCEQ